MHDICIFEKPPKRYNIIVNILDILYNITIYYVEVLIISSLLLMLLDTYL